MWGYEVGTSLLALAILVTASLAGFLLQPRLPEHYHARENVEAIRLVMSMLTAFAGLVLGLLVSAAKSDFDTQTQLLQDYGTALIQAEGRLRDYGPEADPIRALLRSFTATVYVNSWPNAPRPTAPYRILLHPLHRSSRESMELTTMLRDINNRVLRLAPTDEYHAKVQAALTTEIRAVIQDRWTIIEGDHPSIPAPFVVVLMFWLAIVFFTFGLNSPRNKLMVLVIGLASMSVASVLYLIVDLDSRATGFIELSSQPLLDALMHMDAAPAATGVAPDPAAR